MQQKKHDQYMQMVRAREQAEAEELDRRLRMMQEKNHEKDEYIKSIRETKMNRISHVLSNIEQNQHKALQKQRHRIRHIVHKFVHKQVVGQEKRVKLEKDKLKAFEVKRKKFEEKIKHVSELKVQEDKKKTKKNMEDQRDYNKKIKTIMKRKEEEQALLERAAEMRQQKIEEVLSNHELHMEEFVALLDPERKWQ